MQYFTFLSAYVPWIVVKLAAVAPDYQQELDHILIIIGLDLRIHTPDLAVEFQ
jgi:hypothetical protein